VIRRRRAAADAEPADAEQTDVPSEREADGTDQPEPAPRLTAPRGPWDADDLPAEVSDEVVPRVDLGALRVPVQDAEVRVEVSPEGEVVAATMVMEFGAVQLSAFAAPRSEGIWVEVRAEIATALRAGGGVAVEGDGPFGPELRARIPVAGPAGDAGLQPARFVGIDAPRWFLRALITGPAATDPAQAAAVESALRKVVVVRGGQAMGVRDPIALRIPREVVEAAGATVEAAAREGESDLDAEAHVDTQPSLDPFQRGPEITEVR